MPVFPWIKRDTRHFGRVWHSRVRLQMRGTDDRLRHVELLLDTGSVATLVKRSVGELLALEVEAGRQIELGSLAGDRVPAFVHEIPMRAGPHTEFLVPVAVCAHENVPNLLGRFGVWDHLEITLDGTRRETRIESRKPTA